MHPNPVTPTRADAVYDNLAAFTDAWLSQSAHAASPPRDGPPIEPRGAPLTWPVAILERATRRPA